MAFRRIAEWDVTDISVAVNRNLCRRIYTTRLTRLARTPFAKDAIEGSSGPDLHLTICLAVVGCPEWILLRKAVLDLESGKAVSNVCLVVSASVQGTA
jgi:hypothetical protein